MALVMAMLALLILSVLVVAFSLLASTEPTIASNQLRVAQARALAEAGVERAVWALTQGKADSTITGSLASPLPSPVPAPYNGSQFVSVTSGSNTIGGFYVNVTQDPNDSHQRWVQSIGWVPSDTSTDTRRARQTINATLMDFPTITKMPCAVCVRGDIQIGGTSTIDSRPLSGDDTTSCGSPTTKYGTWSTTVKDSAGNTVSPGNTTIGSGLSKVYGAVDGNSTANQSTDMAKFQNQADFDKNAMTSSTLDFLKAYAKSKGTYYQGTVTFSSTNKIPDGIVFVDTVSGNNIVAGTTATTDYASATITGNASANTTGFRGWIVVNGSLSINGSFTMYGLGYAINDLSYVGTGGQIQGQLVSANIKDTIATVIDTSLSGVASIRYNCSATTSPLAGVVPSGFFVRQGTYKEVSN